jgi:hypothetical protein
MVTKDFIAKGERQYKYKGGERVGKEGRERETLIGRALERCGEANQCKFLYEPVQEEIKWV